MGKTRYPYVQMKRAASAFDIKAPRPAYPPASRQYSKKDYGFGDAVKTVAGASVAMVGIGAIGATTVGIMGAFQK